MSGPWRSAYEALVRHMRSADPGLVSLESAVRAAVVIPAVFLVADKLIQQPQTTTFAAFGSFGLLVLTDFSGPLIDEFSVVALELLSAAENGMSELVRSGYGVEPQAFYTEALRLVDLRLRAIGFL